MLKLTKIEDLNTDDREWFEARVYGIPKFSYFNITGISYFDINSEELEVRIATLVIQYDEEKEDLIGADLKLLEVWAKRLEDEGNPKAVILSGWEEFFLIITSYV